MKKLIITEEEKKRIIKMHLSEQATLQDEEPKKTIKLPKKIEKLTQPIKIKLGDNIFIELTEVVKVSEYCIFNGLVRGLPEPSQVLYDCTKPKSVTYMDSGSSRDEKASSAAIKLLRAGCGCDEYVLNQTSQSNDFV